MFTVNTGLLMMDSKGCGYIYAIHSHISKLGCSAGCANFGSKSILVTKLWVQVSDDVRFKLRITYPW